MDHEDIQRTFTVIPWLLEEDTTVSQISFWSSESPNDESCLNSSERHGSDTSRATSGGDRRYLNIATWNVRTMNDCGKLDQVRMEAERLSLDVLGLAETRWTSSGQVNTNGWMLYYVGDDNVHQRGVGFLVSPKTVKSVLKVQPISDRIIMIRLNAKPKPITIIQIYMYMPTTEADDEEILSIYAMLQKVVDECPKKDRLVVMGDFNAQIGADRHHMSCGRYGVGEGNDRGQTLLYWLSDNKLVAVNTCFQHRRNQLYTWCSPGGLWKNQIDFIAIRLRDRRECIDSRALRSADCGTDHQLVWMNRRQAKLNNFQNPEYRHLCKAVKTACRRATRKWLDDVSAEADKSFRSGNSKRTHQLIRQISVRKCPQAGPGIKDENGEMLYEAASIRDRWTEYGTQLFHSDAPRLPKMNADQSY
ncbi:craniofacial development protein 2-like [Amphiura filiformis]|uniref:craniofacial development protein 2-like n=1 Tax=Amphiura filiformis TaxID=82378 RepID=UPI003B217977